MRLEFRMLGPVEALVDGAPAPLGGTRQRAVLALLLAHANEVVPVDQLIDGVWDDAPPDTAANVLQGYVSHLRKVLGRQTIATRGRGYAVVVDDGALDLHRFERYAAAGAGERAAGRAARASADLGAALALWRGPALSDLADLPAVRPIAQRLDELRLNALDAASRPTSTAAGRPKPRPTRMCYRRPSPAGALPGPADARAVPQRAAGRGAGGVPRHAGDARRGRSPGLPRPSAG